VYKNVNSHIVAKDTNILPDEVWTIKAGSDKNVVFEVESCALKGNDLWFHTNESSTKGGIYAYNHSIHALQ
jgi:hypothetical protein